MVEAKTLIALARHRAQPLASRLPALSSFIILGLRARDDEGWITPVQAATCWVPVRPCPEVDSAKHRETGLSCWSRQPTSGCQVAVFSNRWV